MPLFYKGVPASTYYSNVDLRVGGLVARSPTATRTVQDVVRHISDGTINSAYVSLTRSYTVAEEYAFSCRMPPTSTNPGYVWEVQIDDPPPAGVMILDPVHTISESKKDVLAAGSYHHDGGQNVLMGIVSPATMGHVLLSPVKDPPMSGRTPRAPHISRELEALVRALRDSEVLALGNLPRRCFVARHTVF
jgi:hypothetical protein